MIFKGHRIRVFKAGLIPALLTLSNAAVYAQTWQFDFGSGAVESGYTQITSSNVYNAADGYGFGDYEKVDTLTGESLLAYAADVYDADRGAPDDLRSDFCATAGDAMVFDLDLSYGNYDIQLISGDNDQAVASTLADSRRWARIFSTDAGSFAESHVTMNIHSGQLRLLLNSATGRLNALSVTKTNTPTLFIAGDSTVTDQTTPPWAGWGQMMPLYFKPGIAVANYADSGETALSFWSAFYPLFKTKMTTGDFLLIQFGHNDQKNYTTTAYKEYLTYYIDDARSRGAQPILVTPVARDNWSDGFVNDLLGAFPDAMRELAEEEDVPLIDLNALSTDYFQSIGESATGDLFVDISHLNEDGALNVANLVVEGIKTAGLSLTNFVVYNHLPPPMHSSMSISPSTTTAKSRYS